MCTRNDSLSTFSLFCRSDLDFDWIECFAISISMSDDLTSLVCVGDSNAHRHATEFADSGGAGAGGISVEMPWVQLVTW